MSRETFRAVRRYAAIGWLLLGCSSSERTNQSSNAATGGVTLVASGGATQSAPAGTTSETTGGSGVTSGTGGSGNGNPTVPSGGYASGTGGSSTAMGGAPRTTAQNVGGVPSGGATQNSGGTMKSGGTNGFGGTTSSTVRAGGTSSGGATTGGKIAIATGGAPICGNAVCETTEATRNCPADCAVTYPDYAIDLKADINSLLTDWAGLMWQLGKSTFMTWDMAKTYCSDLTLGGYTDWRMPTIQEQEAILGNCTTNSNGDTFCSKCVDSPLCSLWFPKDDTPLWNSYEYSSGTAGAVTFSSGEAVYTYYKTNVMRVRCVRQVRTCVNSPCLDTETCVDTHCLPNGESDAGP